jgi:hypothetical protein
MAIAMPRQVVFAAIATVKEAVADNHNLNYRLLMQEQYTEYKLYLAVPSSTYDSFFQLPFVQMTIHLHQLKLAIYVPEKQEIIKWQN